MIKEVLRPRLHPVFYLAFEFAYRITAGLAICFLMTLIVYCTKQILIPPPVVYVCDMDSIKKYIALTPNFDPADAEKFCTVE